MQYNKDEKKCIRIIAKWFRENKGVVNREEAIKEFGVDDNKYDTLIRMMEHNGIVENVRSVMGENGYAVAFQPSPYAEKLAREFEEEEDDERLNEGRTYGEDGFRGGVYAERSNDKKLQEDFASFLIEEKGWPEVYYDNENYKDMAIDFSLKHPVSRKLIAIFTFMTHIDRRIDSEAAASFAQFADLELGRFLVTPSTKKSNYSFTIYKYSDRGLVRIQPNNFPAYVDSRLSPNPDAMRENFKSNEELRNAFEKFMVSVKGYSKKSLSAVPNLGEDEYRPNCVTEVKGVDGKSLALITFRIFTNKSNYAFEDMGVYGDAMNIHGAAKYLVFADKIQGDIFSILEYEDDGEANPVLEEDFPAYNQMLFTSPLSGAGRRLCRSLVELAKDKHGLSIDARCADYINLQIKKNKRTAAQIHRLNDSDKNIALVLAGYQEVFPDSKSETYMVRGEVSQLSGNTSKYPREMAWLNGNVNHERLRYRAGVYIIQPGSLVLDEIENEVGKLLDSARKNAEKEKAKVEPEALSTARYAVGDSETEDDKLGFGPYVEAVAEFLVHKDTQPPLTMSVEGEWGSGKSSFMRQLKKELRRCAEKNTDRDTKPLLVDFKPWRHDKDEALWAAFALEFIRQASARLGFCERVRTNWKLRYSRFDVKEGWADVAKAVIISIAWVLATAVIVIGLWTGATAGEDGSLELPVKLGALTVVLGSVWLTFGKVKDFLGSPLDVDLRKYMKKPDYVSHVSFIEHFHKDFKDVVRTYARQQSVYVFIDDLDRCRVPKAAELMESINLMISDNPKLVFIMGMDREKVAAGLAVKHEKLLPYLSSQVEIGSGSERNNKRMRGIRYGYSFIEKFIQIPFVLPIPSRDDINNMLLEMAGESEKKVITIEPEKEPPTELGEKSEDIPFEKPEPKPDVPSKETKEVDRAERKEIRKEVMLKFEGDDKNFRSVVLMVSEAFGNNPRRAKQFVNLFRLRIRTAASTGLITPEESQLTFVQLGKFVGIGLGWPLFIRDLERNPRLLDKLVHVAEGENEPKDIDEKIKEWKRDEKLIGLIRSGCFDENKEKKPGGEYERFSMRGLDVENLMKVAPRVKQMEME